MTLLYNLLNYLRAAFLLIRKDSVIDDALNPLNWQLIERLPVVGHDVTEILLNASRVFLHVMPLFLFEHLPYKTWISCL